MSYPAIEAKGVALLPTEKMKFCMGWIFAAQKGSWSRCWDPTAPEKVRCSAACWGCTTATRAASP